MLMLLFFLVLGIYFLVRGGGEAGFWSGNATLNGVLMALAGLVLILAQLLGR
jgi:hypothetical protein